VRRFSYVKPASLSEATAFLENHADETAVLAGGTALISMLSQGLRRPEHVLDIGALQELRGFGPTAGGLQVGALTPIAFMHRDATVKSRYPLLAEAASQVASIRVRNVATVGGSCSYGEPQSDLPPALIAMGATARIDGAKASRWVPLSDFFVGPYETALGPGELLTGLLVPEPQPGTGACHMKFTIGSPSNKPVANASCLVRLEAGRMAAVSIVLGAVGGTPLIAARAAAMLQGQLPDDQLIAAAAQKASEEADPIEDLRGSVWYKRRIVKVLVEKGLRQAVDRAK
jgi:carbon-monoxide dehydrogenase medium subunit